MSRLRYVMLGAGLVVLAVIVRSMGPGEILALVRRVGLAFFVAAFLYWVHLLARAYAIWRALPPRRLTLLDVIRIRMATESIETLTFTGPFLAEPAKGALFIERGLTLADAAGAIAFEYLTYSVMAAWIALYALVALQIGHLLPPRMTPAVIALIAGLGLFSAAFLFAAVTGIGLLVPLARSSRVVLGQRRAHALATRIAPTEQVLLGFLHGRPALLLEVLAAQFVGHALLVAEVWVLLHAMQVPIVPSQAWLIEGGVKFINTAFFFVPGQVGASEGVNAVLVRSLGFPAAAGVTLALLRRLRSLLVAMCGLAALPGRPTRARV